MSKALSLGFLVLVLHLVLSVGSSLAEEVGKEGRSELGFASEFRVKVGQATQLLAFWGESERSFLFFDIYNIAYYGLELGRAPEVLHILYERDLPKEKVHSALKDGLAKNLTETEYKSLSVEVRELLESIGSDIKKGDSLSVMKMSSIKLDFHYNDQHVYTVTEPLLIAALWDIWMGKHSVVDKDALTKYAK